MRYETESIVVIALSNLRQFNTKDKNFIKRLYTILFTCLHIFYAHAYDFPSRWKLIYSNVLTSCSYEFLEKFPFAFYQMTSRVVPYHQWRSVCLVSKLMSKVHNIEFALKRELWQVLRKNLIKQYASSMITMNSAVNWPWLTFEWVILGRRWVF